MEPYNFIISTIKKAGKILKGRYNSDFVVNIKNNNPRNIVTEIDFEVNDFLIKEIKKSFPGHSIYSEEGGGKEDESKFLWVLDPIDGSSNFSRHIPHFAICAGLLENMIPVLGVVFNPITNELFSFKKGEGAFLNDKPIVVSSVKNLSEASIFFRAGSKKENFDWGGASYRKLLEHVNKTNNMGSSALDTCFVAAGRIEANIYGLLTTMDIASAIGILLEAGGRVANGDGKPVVLQTKPQRVIMSNNETIEKSLFEIL